MKNRRAHLAKTKMWLWLYAAAVAATFYCLAPQQADAGNNDCQWKLRQHLDLLGEFDLYVAHDAVKVVNIDWGYELISKAPQWTVHCFRPKEKIEWSSDLKDFNGQMLAAPFEAAGISPKPDMAIGNGVLKGLKYTRYSPSRQSLTALYGADDISIAPQGAEFIARLWDFPNSGKVPIYRCRYKVPHKPPKDAWIATVSGGDLRSGLVIEFVTKSWQKLPSKSSDFACPQGYKRMNRLIDVTFTNKRKDGIDDTLGDLITPSKDADQQKKGPEKSLSR